MYPITRYYEIHFAKCVSGVNRGEGTKEIKRYTIEIRYSLRWLFETHMHSIGGGIFETAVRFIFQRGI